MGDNRRALIDAGLWLAIATVALGAVADWSPSAGLGAVVNAVILYLVFRLQAAMAPVDRRPALRPLLVASVLSVAALTALVLSFPAVPFPVVAAVVTPAVFAVVAWVQQPPADDPEPRGQILPG
jgi:hypothetical protein